MKKVMIVGTGYGQLPLIDACKELGYYSIGVDFDLDSMGASLVDKFYNVDIKDILGVLNLARSENIDGIVTMQSDLPVPTIGMVNQELGLTGVTYQTAMVCSNKDKTRLSLQKHGVTQPKFLIVRSVEDAFSAAEKIGYPCIIKSPDSSGSRGVTKVNHSRDVPFAFKEACEYSRSGEILVEQFIEGIEIGAQTFSQEGECVYCLIHNDTLCENGYLVPNGHSYPFNQISIDELAVKKSIGQALKAVGLLDGPANIDLIVTPEGSVHIIEIGARVGATCLPELTSIYTGLSWEKLVIQNALGDKHTPQEIKGTACAAYVLEAPKDGILTDINYDYDLSDYSAYSPIIEVTAKIGDEVRIFRKGTDRVGRVVVKAETVEEAEKIALELKSKIELVVA
ncbi:ATP-grasp domain-containing protein [Vibrio metschnikovii]|uniref:ATP-grasp domain-containing protein n=1 Tax=Vibrio metschnikovii TaxID=28172 RepID=UPI00164ADED3|nr:ATP-grasp domain-containing protein [Vibrio metschnikovii]MBC5832145.1 ATP-grasp domain-containing protein [Vibrio metschnikovii]